MKEREIELRGSKKWLFEYSVVDLNFYENGAILLSDKQAEHMIYLYPKQVKQLIKELST